MNITRITTANHKYFEPFFVASVNESYKSGDAIIMFGLVEGSIAVGAIAATFTDMDIQILSLYVAPDYRRQGGGSLLVNTLMDLTRDYVVNYSIDYLLNSSDSEELEAFLAAQGFEETRGTISDMYSIKLGDIVDNSVFKKDDSFGVDFASLDEHEYGRLQKYAVATDAYIPEKGLEADGVDKDVSILYKKDDELKGFIVFEKVAEDTLLVSGIQNDGDMTVPSNLMKRAFTECLNKYGANLTLLVEPVNDVVRGFVEMIPAAKNIARSKTKSGLLF